MIIHPAPPVSIPLGPISIHWYGLAYLAGFIGGAYLGVLLARRANSGWRPEEVWDLLFFVALGVIIGGRVGYVLFYSLSELAADPLFLFKIWRGGMSFHGGLLGVVVSVFWFARSTSRSFLAVGDFLAPLTPLGLGLGRIANFVNQELWGRASDMPWAVLFPADPLGIARHPSQIYEALLEGLVLFVVIWVYAKRPRALGRVSGLFLVGYAMSRIIVEFFREPDLHIGFIAGQWLTMGQILSVPMLFLGLFLLFRNTVKP